jgi:hypothetical protein
MRSRSAGQERWNLDAPVNAIHGEFMASWFGSSMPVPVRQTNHHRNWAHRLPHVQNDLVFPDRLFQSTFGEID